MSEGLSSQPPEEQKQHDGQLENDKFQSQNNVSGEFVVNNKEQEQVTEVEKLRFPGMPGANRSINRQERNKG